ncbi:MAG: hypothetical protein JWL81_1429 [Verrucomicrobiales bacterium]|nr:hypothetical protein [Verrucomicrobiales bacterium]
MAEQAQVKSVEALESLRASFITYQAKSRRAVDMAMDEVTRTRQWLLVDCRLHWEGQIRQITRQLERARAELMTVRLSALVDRSARHEEAVKKSERALEHAHDKLRQVKRWARDFENAVGPHVRRLESVREHFMHELPKASAWLHQAEMTLEAYAERRPGSMPAPSGTDAAISGDATPTSPSPASAEKASALTTPTSESLT